MYGQIHVWTCIYAPPSMDPLAEEASDLDALDAWADRTGRVKDDKDYEARLKDIQAICKGQLAPSSCSGRARWRGQGPQAVQGHLHAHREMGDRAHPEAQGQGLRQDHAEEGVSLMYLETGHRLRTHDSQGGDHWLALRQCSSYRSPPPRAHHRHERRQVDLREAHLQGRRGGRRRGRRR